VATNPPNPPVPPNPPEPAAKFSSSPTFMAMINELNVNIDQLAKRQKLITEIEQALTARYNSPNRLVAYVMRFGHARTSMHTSDIPSIEALLKSVTGAEQINLLVHSPGGDGTITEKIIDMCRAHLTGANTKFRVIVPNIAKSAATILALGTDQIIMGYTSELGPIDPQVPVVVSGIPQYVSAFAFVEARDKLMKQITEATKKKEPTVGLLTQLAGLNVPFIDEMENQMAFSRKTAVTLLNKYMLVPVHKSAATRKKSAEAIAKQLLSKELFPVHGHYINGQTAKDMGLQVDLLDMGDPLWKLIWDYYMRCELQMNVPLQPGPHIKTKLFESGNQVSLVSQDTP